MIEIRYDLVLPDQPDVPPSKGPARYGRDAYARQMAALLPPGNAWRMEPGGVLWRLLRGFSAELERIDQRAAALLREWSPDSALETLPAWEEALGLPDECAGQISDSISERRAAVVQRYVSRGGQAPASFIEIAAALGYVGASIEEFRPLRAGFRAGDPACGTAWSFAWRLHLPIDAPAAGAVFRAGSRAGDRLSGFGQLDIQCIIRRAAPAHTVVLFSFR